MTELAKNYRHNFATLQGTPRKRGNPEGTDVTEKSSDSSPGVPEDSPSSKTEKPSSDGALSEKSEQRFQKLVNTNKELEAQLAAEREELRKLREQNGSAEILKALRQQKKPDGYDDWSDEDKQAFAAQSAAQAGLDQKLPPELLSEIRQALLKDHVMDVLEHLNRKQADAVAKVLNEYDNRMPVEDAAVVAARRQPDLFKQPKADKAEVDREPADPAAFASQKPGSAGRERTSALDREIKELEERARATSSLPERMRLLASRNALARQRQG